MHTLDFLLNTRLGECQHHGVFTIFKRLYSRCVRCSSIFSAGYREKGCSIFHPTVKRLRSFGLTNLYIVFPPFSPIVVFLITYKLKLVYYQEIIYAYKGNIDVIFLSDAERTSTFISVSQSGVKCRVHYQLSAPMHTAARCSGKPQQVSLFRLSFSLKTHTHNTRPIKNKMEREKKNIYVWEKG